MVAQGGNDIRSQTFCHSELQKFSFTYNWIINNFNSLVDNTEWITSSLFEIEGYPMTGTMSLSKQEILLRTNHKYKTTALILFAKLDSDSVPLTIYIEASLLDAAGNKMLTVKKHIRKISTMENAIELSPIRFNELQEYKLIQENTVKLTFAITVTAIATTCNKRGALIPSSENSLISDFSKLLKDPKHSDVTITVGSKKYCVHKVILSTRSSVFAAMFEHEMEENHKNNIEMRDMSEEVVEELLKFIYTDATDKLDSMVYEMLYAAEKYDLKNLKTRCDQRLQKNINSVNAAEMLIIADRYNLKETKADILHYINTHRADIVKTDGYKSMKETHPQLVIEVLEMMQFGHILKP